MGFRGFHGARCFQRKRVLDVLLGFQECHGGFRRVQAMNLGASEVFRRVFCDFYSVLVSLMVVHEDSKVLRGFQSTSCLFFFKYIERVNKRDLRKVEGEPCDFKREAINRRSQREL